ncbi:MAG: hypothetical protein QOG10_5326 [Kribbellaceae bacterium]|nr:hypothetical protein [Kribbellaceae bacterium]
MSRGWKKQEFQTGLPIVNLLPPSVFEALSARKVRLRFLAAGLALALFVGAGWGVQRLQIEEAGKLQTVEQGETARLDARTRELAPVSDFVSTVASQQALVRKTMANEAFVSLVLDGLRHATPTGVRIDSVTVTIEPSPGVGAAGATAVPKSATAGTCPSPDPFTTQATVGCAVLAGTATDRAAVGQLVIRLAKSGVFIAPYISTTTATTSTSTSTAASERVAFTGSVSLTKRVYSNRYAAIGAPVSGG